MTYPLANLTPRPPLPTPSACRVEDGSWGRTFCRQIDPRTQKGRLSPRFQFFPHITSWINDSSPGQNDFSHDDLNSDLQVEQGQGVILMELLQMEGPWIEDQNPI